MAVRQRLLWIINHVGSDRVHTHIRCVDTKQQAPPHKSNITKLRTYRILLRTCLMFLDPKVEQQNHKLPRRRSKCELTPNQLHTSTTPAGFDPCNTKLVCLPASLLLPCPPAPLCFRHQIPTTKQSCKYSIFSAKQKRLQF